jgi:hypothetical protein
MFGCSGSAGNAGMCHSCASAPAIARHHQHRRMRHSLITLSTPITSATSSQTRCKPISCNSSRRGSRFFCAPADFWKFEVVHSWRYPPPRRGWEGLACRPPTPPNRSPCVCDGLAILCAELRFTFLNVTLFPLVSHHRTTLYGYTTHFNQLRRPNRFSPIFE